MRTDDVADRLADAIQDAADAANHPQVVPVNMYEADEAYVVIAPLAGVTAEDVEVTTESGWLHITAEMRTPAIKAYLIHEWHYGPFARDLRIPDDCGARVEASFGNGQLAVRLLKGGAPSAPVTVRPNVR